MGREWGEKGKRRDAQRKSRRRREGRRRRKRSKLDQQGSRVYPLKLCSALLGLIYKNVIVGMTHVKL